MPRKKPKGRGRGRGRGQSRQDDPPQVGKSTDTQAACSEESEKPGSRTNPGDRNDGEVEHTESTKEKTVRQPHKEKTPGVAHHNQGQALSDVPQRDEKPKQKQEEKPSTPSHPQGTRTNSKNGQVVASAMSEEKPSHLRQQQKPLPTRPGYGNQGRPIRLRANFFRLDFRNIEYIYHYDVEIKPEKTPISECREVVKCTVEKYKDYFNGFHPAFDGKRNLYCREKLPSVNESGSELEVKLPGVNGGKDRAFKLTIKYAAQVRIADLNQFLSGKGKVAQEAVQALDIVLRQIPSLYFTPVRRSFFPSRNGISLGGGCEVKTGFYQSIRPSQWKTMLVNIDVSSKGFVKAQPVIDLLCEIAQVNEAQIADRRWRMDRRKEREFLETVKGFRVETGHLGRKRKYLVVDLGKSAETHTFTLRDDDSGPAREISVRDYFEEKYKIRLRYPHLPCLIVGQKKNYLPMEVCDVVASQKRKLTDAQTAEMIKKVTKPARERQSDIQNWATELENDTGQYLQQEYGMSINSKMVEVDGRILPAPKVTLGNNGSIVPRDGVWDMRNRQFYRSCDNVQNWAMVCFLDQRRYGDNVTRKFAQQMSSVCSTEGIQMNKEPCSIMYARSNDNIENIFSNLLVKFQSLQLIIVALPPYDNKEIYKEVKRVGDTVLGIPTQCVQAKQFNDAKPQVCSNIAMKINAKLGGTNHVIDLEGMPPLFQDVIVFGADVTHPSPGENNIPSIAAVVASMDCFASRYAARVRAQTHMKDKSAQEIILDMAAMVKELLVEFYKKTKLKPKRIIFYRDGVSEGQFDQVLLHEVSAVQKACLDIQRDGQYQPPITFIVVQKRHHARFFCTDKRDESGRAGNVPPGTMVDRGITHPFEFDFYLCSHQGIQGTSRPTHYHVLYDDNNFDANSLHKLTYHLCHTYARCTRSVSMPSPAYYAHLVAFRARHHLNGMASSTNGRNEKPPKELLEEFTKAINVNDKMKGGMYFA